MLNRLEGLFLRRFLTHGLPARLSAFNSVPALSWASECFHDARQARQGFATRGDRRSFASQPAVWPTDPPNIERLLVANRGEIACRVLITAKRLGARSNLVALSRKNQLNQGVISRSECLDRIIYFDVSLYLHCSPSIGPVLSFLLGKATTAPFCPSCRRHARN